MDISQAQQVMLRTHLAALKYEARANGIYLESGAGIGKSEGTFQYGEALAKAINKPVGIVQFMLATISSVDVRGFMLPVKGSNGALDTVFSQPPWFPSKSNTWVVTPMGVWSRPGAFDPPDVGILFLDEFGQADDDVKKPAAELIYKGNVGTCELPLGWRVIAAGNRMSDRSGVVRELMFLVNRRCRLSIDASLPAFLAYQNSRPTVDQLHYLTLSFAQQHPDIVFQDKVPDGSDPFCTPRSLCLLDRDLMALRSDEDISNDRLPIDSIAREVAAGWIGPGASAQLFTHLKYADMLPDIQDVLDDPAEAKLPPSRDAQMVCAYMLAHHVNEKSAGNIFTYLKRLHIEIQVVAIITTNQNPTRAQALQAQPMFTQWLVKNKELLVASHS
jgi:hypothetical protein